MKTFGRLKWQTKISFRCCWDSALSDNVAYFSSFPVSGYGSSIHALDAKTGKEKWRFDDNCKLASGLSKFTISNNMLCLRNENDMLRALDLKMGKEKWNFQTVKYENNSFCSPTIADDIVYCEDIDNLYAINADTGREKWRFRLLWPQLPEDLSIGYSIVNGNVYFINPADDDICVLNKETGYVKMRFKNNHGEVRGRFEIVHDTLYVNFSTSNNKGICALDIKTGEEKWRWTCAKAIFTLGKVIINNTVLVFDHSEDGEIYSLDAKTGSERWKLARTPGPLVINNGVLCLVDKIGRIYTLDGETGKEKWRSEIKGFGGYGTIIINYDTIYGLNPIRKSICALHIEDGKEMGEFGIEGYDQSGYVVLFYVADSVLYFVNNMPDVSFIYALE